MAGRFCQYHQYNGAAAGHGAWACALMLQVNHPCIGCKVGHRFYFDTCCGFIHFFLLIYTKQTFCNWVKRTRIIPVICTKPNLLWKRKSTRKRKTDDKTSDSVRYSSWIAALRPTLFLLFPPHAIIIVVKDFSVSFPLRLFHYKRAGDPRK